MKSLIWGIVLLLTSCAAFAQEEESDPSFCNCDSAVYVSPEDGSIWVDAWSRLSSPYSCFDGCTESAHVDLTLSDNSGDLYSDGADDNLTYGDAEVQAQFVAHSASLNDTYTINANHYVWGEFDLGYSTDPDCYFGCDELVDIWWDTSSQHAQDIPAAPTIFADEVNAPGGSYASIHYHAQPDVLVLADMSVGPDYSTTSSPNNADMPFNQSDMGYGVSTFAFNGYMYGVTVPGPSGIWVQRNPNVFNPVYKTVVAYCDANGNNQAFTIQVNENADQFTYSVPFSGVTDLSNSGGINIQTAKAADCQFTIGVPTNTPGPTGSNEVRDVLFQDFFAYMSQPTFPTVPTQQSPTYQSLINNWAYFVAPNAWGHLCTTFWVDGDNIGVLTTTQCLDTNLP